MPRICAELLHPRCRQCFEVENCVSVAEVAEKLTKECGVAADLEALAVIEGNTVLSQSTSLCRDAELRVVRLLRGGCGPAQRF
ncbi:MAG: hypothetical protein ACP5KA_03965 [Desulfurococcaceae archaeon]